MTSPIRKKAGEPQYLSSLMIVGNIRRFPIASVARQSGPDEYKNLFWTGELLRSLVRHH